MIQKRKLKQKHGTKYKNLPTSTYIRTLKNKFMPKIVLLNHSVLSDRVEYFQAILNNEYDY